MNTSHQQVHIRKSHNIK